MHSSLQEAERSAADAGVILTAADRQTIQIAQEAEIRRLRSLQAQDTTTSKTTRFVGAFNAFYPRFLQSLIGLGEVVLTFSQTIIVSLGVPCVLVLLLIVEQQRVWHGIALFEPDIALASFAAWALVILNLVLEFTIEHIEHQAGYHAVPASRFSLRSWARSAGYTLGMGGEKWRAQELSPAQRYRRLLRLVTFSILALALAGSMRVVIASADGPWYEAIGSIVTGSSLALMTTWIGGLLFAAAAVLSAQGLSRYVAIRCVEILAAMKSNAAAQATQDADSLDNVAASYIMAKVAQKQAQDAERERLRQERNVARQSAKIEASDNPFLAAPIISSNGHHHG